MKSLLLSFFISFNTLAIDTFGGHFFDTKTKQKIALTCQSEFAIGTVGKCEEAFFTLIETDGSFELLHHFISVPMDQSNDAHYTRYHRFYVVRDLVAQNRAIGKPQAWGVWNAMNLDRAFKKAIPVMISGKDEDKNTGIKLSHGNFKELVKVIQETL